MTDMKNKLEEQLEKARLRKQRAAARLQQLEAKKKALDVRRRAKAEKQLLQLVLARAGDVATFREELKRAVNGSDMADADRDGILALLEASPSPALPNEKKPPRPSGAPLGSGGEAGRNWDGPG